jgi:hypothetical protein
MSQPPDSVGICYYIGEGVDHPPPQEKWKRPRGATPNEDLARGGCGRGQARSAVSRVHPRKVQEREPLINSIERV